MRVGIGFDAHRFSHGRKLILGGVEIPDEVGLSGHSDADVVIHALMDAILGACGERDIGFHFPSDDPTFEGISSVELLSRVVGMVRGRGFRVSNADITVVCEKPRISDLHGEITSKLSRILGIEKESVSLKGTTTEGMGFTGRSEGIASIAVVLLEEAEKEQR
ncbi:MAG: 2-C-methyl-D-erythritol 2,4-cyclodiphosphate synthase [Actinomycetota bacterium]|nr:2-C-methyl-D-erythritol 2,4-cyclodiphosphate synthase [Actinomycetota bacterium]